MKGAMVFEPVRLGWSDSHLRLKTVKKLAALCPKDKRTKVSEIDEPSVADRLDVCVVARSGV
jgi:hypothetical protein